MGQLHNIRFNRIINACGSRVTSSPVSAVSLDLPTEAEQAEKEPAGFLARHPPPVIIDEAQ